MIKTIYLNDDDTIACSGYAGENREEWEFMSKHSLGDGSLEAALSINKEKQKEIIKMYEERFPIKTIYKRGCIYKTIRKSTK